jgi:predicted phage terminase large subunit-like protein
VVAVCDTAEKGTDSVCMPIAYVYGEDVFIEDCVFNNGTPAYTKPECAKVLVKHKVATCTFESNAAGEYFGRDVERLVQEMGGRISVRLKRSISNKQTRIEQSSDAILKHFYFKDKSLYSATSEYGEMMRELTGYTRSGKVKHDDAPDGLSLLENELRGLAYGKVKVISRAELGF